MRPVNRLCKFFRCSHVQQALELTPVGRQGQTGVFFRRVYMFIYKSTCTLSVLAFVLSANAEEGSTVPRQSLADGTAVEYQLDGRGRRVKSVGAESAAISAGANARLHAANTAARTRTASPVSARKYSSVMAIGAPWRDGSASIVQRTNHQFYVVRAFARILNNGVTPLGERSQDSADAKPNHPDVQSIGNLFIDAALFSESAISSNGGQQ